MRRTILVGVAAGGLALAALAGGPSPAGANPTHPNGQITYERGGQIPDEAVVAVVNPDGSGLRNVSPLTPFGLPHWSPDGTRIVAVSDVPGIVATIFNVDTGSVTTVPNYLPINLGCSVWSPDGLRLACTSSYNEVGPGFDGLYTVRASDGGGLTRVTSSSGGEDDPGSYSPNGKRIEFARFNDDGPVGLFVINANGTGLKQITPAGLEVGGDRFGDWSSKGNEIVFAARTNADNRFSIWVVHADGSGLRQIQFDTAIPCGGLRADPASRGCFDATWSPDGKQIAFIVNEPSGEGESLYTANIDGTNLTQLTHGDSENPDWGTRPPT